MNILIDTNYVGTKPWRPYTIRIFYENGVIMDRFVKSFGAAKRYLDRGQYAEMPNFTSEHKPEFATIYHIPTKRAIAYYDFTK